ncbi:glycosyltransferase family 4 protein [Priestia aryabhattai]|uniref:glycosyltransferase family 4 protein n=1 Tax=Priestia aryabhattai TaxID=412384 RepID=UPI0035628300
MKVLHLPSGSDISMLSQQLRTMGIDATSCSFSSSDIYSYRADVRLNLNDYPPDEKKKKLEAYFKEAMNTYDVFHFHFGKTFNSKTDLALLKRNQKKLIVHHRGSEVRTFSIASRNNPYVYIKSKWPEETIQKYLKRLSNYIDNAIVPDYELKSYIEPYYKKIHVVPRAINSHEYTPKYPIAETNPIIVHAPSHTEVKGTNYVLAAVDRLEKEGLKFQFKLIENLPHKEALKEYQKATIIIDQLRIGSYANLSMEAMAMGKPVICYIRDDLFNKFPGKLPIVNANPDTIYDVLKDLLNHPERWEDLGKKGRNYVEEYHSVEKVARSLIDIYKTL